MNKTYKFKFIQRFQSKCRQETNKQKTTNRIDKKQRKKINKKQTKDKQTIQQRGNNMAKSETKGLSLDDLNRMFEVTDEKKKNMASFKGKQMMKLPVIGDKKGIVVKPKMSKDDEGNEVPILQIKNEKLMSTDKTMKLLTVEDFDDPGTEYTIPYGSTLHYSFVGIVESHGWKFEDIFKDKWFKITAADFKTDKAETGKGTAYRASYREDLSKLAPAAARPSVTKTSDEF